jgi:hypothetical protein
VWRKESSLWVAVDGHSKVSQKSLEIFQRKVCGCSVVAAISRMQVYLTAAGLLQRMCTRLHISDESAKIASVVMRELVQSHLALLRGRSLETILLCVLHATLRFAGLDVTFAALLAHRQFQDQNTEDIVAFSNGQFVPASASWLVPLLSGAWKSLPPLPSVTGLQSASIQPSPNVKVQCFASSPGSQLSIFSSYFNDCYPGHSEGLASRSPNPHATSIFSLQPRLPGVFQTLERVRIPSVARQGACMGDLLLSDVCHRPRVCCL